MSIKCSVQPDGPPCTTYLVVEPGRGADCEEELAAVGVWAGVGHAERVGPVVAQARVQLVLELAAPDGLAAGADPGRVAGLQINEEMAHSYPGL